MYERIQGNDMYDGATNPPFGYTFNTNNVLPIHTRVGRVPRLRSLSYGECHRTKCQLSPSRVSQHSTGVQQAAAGGVGHTLSQAEKLTITLTSNILRFRHYAEGFFRALQHHMYPSTIRLESPS